MQNNWVLLQGRLCHIPNYSATKKGLHKVAFRLAVARPSRSLPGTFAAQPSEIASATTDLEVPPLSAHSDYVTVIIIGKPAWDFKQLDLQMGAAVRVRGHLRSWDYAPEETQTTDAPAQESESSADSISGDSTDKHLAARDYRLEVIAEKVDPLNGQGS